MATKSTFPSLSVRRSSPLTRSKSLLKPNSSPCTRSRALPEPNSSLRTRSRALPKPNSSPGTDGITPRTPFSLGAITPIGKLKSVTLSDWWLTKSGEEKTLSIAGFESRGGSEVRLFTSGTISKRHNSTTLKAIDGITIYINGFINRSRTLQNGISSEVCNRFLLGFPYDWEDYNEDEEKKKNVDTDFSISFDDIPVSRLQDLYLLEGGLKNKILDDVVDSLRDLVCQKSDKKCEISRMGDESLGSRVVGVKTRGMRRREDDEASIGKRVHAMIKRKRR